MSDLLRGNPPFGFSVPQDLFSSQAEDTVRMYANALGHWGGEDSFPRNLAAIASKLKHAVRTAPLPVGIRGLRLGGLQPTIVVSEHESQATQNRTIAHELIHPFVGVGHMVGHGRLQARVEELCEIGAAELHMPNAEVQRLLGGMLSIDRLPEVAGYFDSFLERRSESHSAILD